MRYFTARRPIGAVSAEFIQFVREYVDDSMAPVPHDHTEHVKGCFRCELSRDEVR